MLHRSRYLENTSAISASPHSDPTHADLFRERFDGERFDPKDRGRGSHWHQWRKRPFVEKLQTISTKFRRQQEKGNSPLFTLSTVSAASSTIRPVIVEIQYASANRIRSFSTSKRVRLSHARATSADGGATYQVKLKNALAIAGATVTTPISPTPVGGLLEVTILVWISGTSLIRSTG